jgi:hypothetical protein
MHNMTFAVYPIPLEDAFAIAEEVGLPGATFIEPSRFTGFLCSTASADIHFRLNFNDAQRWPSDPYVSLMITAAASDEVRDWSLAHPGSGQLVEVTAFAFQSPSDQQRFEDSL